MGLSLTDYITIYLIMHVRFDYHTSKKGTNHF